MASRFSLLCDISECGKFRVLVVVPHAFDCRPLFMVFDNDEDGLKTARHVSQRIAADMQDAGAKILAQRGFIHESAH